MTKTQAERDAEMKRKLKAQMASGSATATPTPKPTPAPPAAKTQAERDAEMKRKLKAQMASGSSTATPTPAPAPPAAKTQAQRDAEMKQQLKAQMATPTPSPAPAPPAGGQGEKRNSQRDAEMKANIRAHIDATAEGNGDGASQPTSAAEVAVSTGKADEDEEAVPPNPPIRSTSQGSSASLAKERPSAGEGSAKVGAFSVAQRAYGGMPAWVREQARARAAAQAQGSSSSLPPEMRGGESQSSLPPEMRGAMATTEDDSNLPPEMRNVPPEMAAIPSSDKQESESDEEVVMADFTVVNKQEGLTRNEKYGAAAIVVLGVVAIVVAVVIVTGGGDEVVESTRAPRTTPPTQSPTVFVVPECVGYEDIINDPEIMSVGVRSRYEELLTDFAPNYWPGYIGPANRNEYCDSQHLTLSWLSEDDAENTLNETSLENRFLLSNIFFATDGSAWEGEVSGWLNKTDECTWSGITCDENNAVIEINLSGVFPGDAVFPTAITFLKRLRSLSLVGNGIEGTIPSSLGQLSELEILNLRSNNFVGRVPLEDWITLSNLRTIHLANNTALEPELTPDIQQLSSLEFVSFSRTGAGKQWPLPTEIGLLSRLEVLDLRNVRTFKGEIPTEIGQLTALKCLKFLRNALTGSLPTQIGNLANLEILDIQDALGLDGTIPTEIGQCSSLGAFNLHLTSVEGQVPAELSNLPNLSYLDLSNTNLEGTFPDSIAASGTLKSISLAETFLAGTTTIDIRNSAGLDCFFVEESSIQTAVVGDTCEVVYEDSSSFTMCDAIGRNDCSCCSESGLDCTNNEIWLPVDTFCGTPADLDEDTVRESYLTL